MLWTPAYCSVETSWRSQTRAATATREWSALAASSVRCSWSALPSLRGQRLALAGPHPRRTRPFATTGERARSPRRPPSKRPTRRFVGYVRRAAAPMRRHSSRRSARAEPRLHRKVTRRSSGCPFGPRGQSRGSRSPWPRAPSIKSTVTVSARESRGPLNIMWASGIPNRPHPPRHTLGPRTSSPKR